MIDVDGVLELHKCSRTACKAPGADHFHKHLRQWYCWACARDINRLTAGDGLGHLLHKAAVTIIGEENNTWPDHILVVKYEFTTDIPAIYELVRGDKVGASADRPVAYELVCGDKGEKTFSSDEVTRYLLRRTDQLLAQLKGT